MTWNCLTTYAAGLVTSPQMNAYGGNTKPMLSNGRIHFEVTWNVTCKTGVTCSTECKSSKSTMGPYSYSAPFNSVITDRDIQKKVANCKDNTCKYKVLGEFFGYPKPDGGATSEAWVNEEILSLIRNHSLLVSITPSHNMCECVEEGQTLDACNQRCEWENRTRARAINDAYLKKSLSN